MHTDRILLGITLTLLFCTVAAMIDVSAKLAAARIPVGQITAARFVVQAALMAPIVALLGLSFRMSGLAIWLMFMRAVCLIASTYTFVTAVAVMPIADALAIVFVEPFILLNFGWLIFGDEVGLRRIAACFVGFAGALLVIRPSFAAFGTVTLYPLATALSFSLYMLVTLHYSEIVSAGILGPIAPDLDRNCGHHWLWPPRHPPREGDSGQSDFRRHAAAEW